MQDDFQEKVTNSETPVLVDFHAEWCGPCKRLAPMLEELGDKFEGQVKVVKVDIDQNPDLVSEFAIRGVPTIIGFENGKTVFRETGFAGMGGLEELFLKLSS